MNALPESKDSPGSGLKPIDRLTGDSRLERIIPNTIATYSLPYHSQFVRGFIHDHWSFCAAKLTVARRGKVKALDIAFRDADDWFKASLAWIAGKSQRKVHLQADTFDLNVTHPYCGNLMRLMTNYDKLSAATLFALVSLSISTDERASKLEDGQQRFKRIHTLCEPDTSLFNDDGSRVSTNRDNTKT
jgi:hypothetical protein